MRPGLAARATILVAALASVVAVPAHASGTRILSCAVSSQVHFDSGVQMTSVPQTVSGDLRAPGLTLRSSCAPAPDGIAGVEATFTGQGAATCLTDPVLTAVNLTGTMAITWKKADGATVGSSVATWAANRLDLGSVVLTGRVSSGLFKGATLSVSGPSADAVTSVSGGCAPGSPLTDVRTSDTYLRLGVPGTGGLP